VTGQPSPQTPLMQVLGFTPDDLEANRAGRMSAMQHYRLRLQRRRSIFLGALVLLVVTLIASLSIFAGSRQDGSAILTVIGIGVTICNAALMGVVVRHWLRLTMDIRDETVQMTSGALERVIKPVTRRVVNTLIRVDGMEIMVSKEAFGAFEHGSSYTLYRAPHTGRLLSAERVE